MKNTICPVCGKPDIPDYHKEDVTCPQCKSDLSIYRVIDSIPEENRGFNIWKAISAVAILATAVCGFFLLQNKTSGISGGSYISKNQDQEELISQLTDSIKTLQTEIQKVETKSTSYPYIVRRGDSYCLISKKIYGTELRAEEIAINNNRTLQTPLFVGDTLNIK